MADYYIGDIRTNGSYFYLKDVIPARWCEYKEDAIRFSSEEEAGKYMEMFNLEEYLIIREGTNG